LGLADSIRVLRETIAKQIAFVRGHRIDDALRALSRFMRFVAARPAPRASARSREPATTTRRPRPDDSRERSQDSLL